MNSWFTVKVKYTKQLDDGTFKRVSEPYLLAAMTFTDAEARIYEELGCLIRGEFIVTGIARTDIHDIFHYEDSDVWFKCKIVFESGGDGEEGGKAKRVAQLFLVSAHSVKEAYDRLHESLGGMLIDFGIPQITVSPIVDIFPFGDDGEDRMAVEFEKQVKREVADFVSLHSSIENVEMLLIDAATFVVKKQKASIGMLQRQFKLGYRGATKLMHHLETAGIISGFNPEASDQAAHINFDDEHFALKHLEEMAESTSKVE